MTARGIMTVLLAIGGSRFRASGVVVRFLRYGSITASGIGIVTAATVSFMKMPNPCKDCEDRRLGCHSTCERYARFWQQNRQANRKRRQETKLNTYVAEAVRRVKSGRNGSWEAYRKMEEK